MSMEEKAPPTRIEELEADIINHIEVLKRNPTSRWYDQSKRSLAEKIRELAELKGLS